MYLGLKKKEKKIERKKEKKYSVERMKYTKPQGTHTIVLLGEHHHLPPPHY